MISMTYLDFLIRDLFRVLLFDWIISVSLKSCFVFSKISVLEPLRKLWYKATLAV